MSNEKVIKKLNAYIGDWQENPQYAVMIDGEWGSGKTHFVREYIEKRNDKDRLAWYISAFGVKSVDELDDRLFEAAHPIVTDKNNKKWLALSYNVLRGAAKHKIGVDLKDFVQPLLDIFSKKEEAYSNCQVLFVDDIERTNIPLKELFGYFSQIIDKETRVVFIANLEELKKQDCYKDLQEKLVIEIYKIEPDFESAINVFWQSELDNKFPHLKVKTQNIVKKINGKNLRDVHRVIFGWKQLVCNLPADIKSEDEYLDDMFEEFFVLYYNYIKGEFQEFCKAEKQEIDKVLKKMRELMKAFHQINYIPELKGGGIWPKVILEEEYDNKEWLMEQFSEAHKMYCIKEEERKNNIREANNNLNKLKRYVFYNDTEKDIKGCFENLVKELGEGKYVRFDEIMSFIQIYFRLMHEEILPEKYDREELINILHKLLKEHKGRIYGLSGIEKASKENLMHVDNDELQNCIYELFEAAQRTMGIDAKDIFQKKEIFLSFISERQKAVTDMTDVKFLQNLDINNVFEWLGEDIKEHKKLLAFLEFRYRKDFIDTKMLKNDYSELDYVEDIINRYNKLCNTLVHSYRLDYREFKNIRDKYYSLAEYMRKEINHNKGV